MTHKLGDRRVPPPGFFAQLFGILLLTGAFLYGVRVPMEGFQNLALSLTGAREVGPLLYTFLLLGTLLVLVGGGFTVAFYRRWSEGTGRKMYLKCLVLTGIALPLALNMIGGVAMPAYAEDGASERGEVAVRADNACESRTGLHAKLPRISFQGAIGREGGGPFRIWGGVAFCGGEVLDGFRGPQLDRLDLSPPAAEDADEGTPEDEAPEDGSD